MRCRDVIVENTGNVCVREQPVTEMLLLGTYNQLKVVCPYFLFPRRPSLGISYTLYYSRSSTIS